MDVEKTRSLVGFSRTTTKFPRCQGVHRLFEAQAECRAESIAVISVDESIRYNELNARANQLSHRLTTKGVAPGACVGIYAERSIETVIGVLGILKAGGAYVPLDPLYPEERLVSMLKNAPFDILLYEGRFPPKAPCPAAQLVRIDRDDAELNDYPDTNPVGECEPLNLAFVIYTSGSTGEPRRVMISHHNFWQYLHAMQASLGIYSDDVYLHTASLAFNASNRQLMLPLSQGGTIVLASAKQRADPLALFDLMRQKSVTILDTNPSYWRTCIKCAAVVDPHQRAALLGDKLRLILSTSDVLFTDQTSRWALDFGHNASIVNMWGQTETTGIVTTHPLVSQSGAHTGVVPVGRPIANAKVYVLDPGLSPVPIGELGELYVGGDGLARGYLDQPAVTAEKFVPDPFSDRPGSRLYRTGDLGRFLNDGTVAFVGRRDHQLKIHGYRVEPNDVIAAIAAHPAVHDATIVARRDQYGENRIVAYVVANPDASLTTSVLRGFVKTKLPDYMNPSNYVFLDELPLTPNGKVDRNALPSPHQTSAKPETCHFPVLTPVQQLLTQLWSDTLEISDVGLFDDFFLLGGDSLRAMECANLLHQILRVDVSAAEILELGTVARTADLLIDKETEPARLHKMASIALRLRSISSPEATRTFEGHGPDNTVG